LLLPSEKAKISPNYKTDEMGANVFTRQYLPKTGCLLLLIAGLSCQPIIASDKSLPKRIRQPVAMALDDTGNRLFVANHRAGTISTLDTQLQKTIAETDVGESLADLALLTDNTHLLAVDESAHQLVVLKRKADVLHVVRRLQVSPYPVSMVVSKNDEYCCIASLWSRRLSIIDLSAINAPRIVSVIDLPFAPRKQILVSDTTLIVADSFGGALGIIDVKSGRLKHLQQIEAHNIRGLAVSSSRKELLISHQILYSDKATTTPGVHWGGVLINTVRRMMIDALVAGKSEITRPGSLSYLGIPDRAAGDPGDLVVSRDNRQIVAFAGVNEVALSDDGISFRERLAVGRRPSAIRLSLDQKHCYVANRFSDSISVVGFEPFKQIANISLGPRPKLTTTARGEMLFYDSRLASDGWYSCHSCHTDGHSNGGLNDNFGDDSYGAPKRVLSLLGTGRTAPWAWNGRVDKLEQQVRRSIEVTMRGPEPTVKQVQAIVAYVRTLRPPPSVAKLRGQDQHSLIEPGRKLFKSLGCTACHEPPNYTSRDSFDVGIADENGQKQFNPPSLRGVSQRGSFFHDSRAKNLSEVLQRFQHGLDQAITETERDALIRFLNSL
jgi:cytochrome c peroxidase/DNA-binding beta-propeller fold protein YncE